jgi:hypothetical protein
MWDELINFLFKQSPLSTLIKPYLFLYDTQAEFSIFEVGGLLRDALQDCYSSSPPGNCMGTFDPSRPILVVVHSMGGLVARSFMQQHWFSNGPQGGERVQRLITLGTPHHGVPGPAEAIGEVFFGLASVYSRDMYRDGWWDGQDNLDSTNAWLRDLNCLPAGICPRPDHRQEFFEKIFAYAGTGLSTYDNDDVKLDDFGVDGDRAVSVESALFYGALFEGKTIGKARPPYENCFHLDMTANKCPGLFTDLAADILGAPTADTWTATNVAQNSATLNGTVNPNGQASTASFQWGTTTAYGATTASQPPVGSGATNVNVFANLTGLSASTTYHYRVVATNSGGTTTGLDAAFTTPTAGGPPPPPKLILPGLPSFPGSSVSTLAPQFQWHSVQGADAYGLYIENSAGTQIFSNETLPGGVASFILPIANSLANGQSYNWSMRSHGAAGWSTTRSDRFYFSVSTGQNPRDFSLSLSPATLAVTAGGAASLVVNTTTVSGTPQLVSFVAGGLPSGTTATFSPSSAVSGSSSMLTISADSTTPGGVYPISVAGVSDALVTHWSSFALTVNPQVAGTPAVCLTPSSLAFGDQMAGTTGPSQLVTMRNCGSGSLRVTAITASADFAIAPGSIIPPVDLPAATSTTFQVVFAPQSGGSKSGQVQIFSNAPGSPHSVALRGSAIPAPATDGTVQVNATLNGQPYSGSVQFSLTQTPGGTLNGGSVPSTFTSRPPATYTVGLLAAPGGSTLVGVSPAATQILQAGGSLSFSLDFTAPNDFVLLAANPRARSVLAGNSTTYTVEVGRVKGGTQQITVSVSGVPSGASPSFNPQPIALTGAGAGSTLTVSTTPQTLPGIYALKITSTNQDGTTRSTPAVLSVVTPSTMSLASIANSGAQGNAASSRPAISADGRFVAFVSSAGNLTAEPPTAYPRIFVRDRQSGQTTLASLADNGSLPDFNSYAPSISGDGRYVAFHSEAGNLSPDATLGVAAVYVRDLNQRHTQLVSVAPDGTPANGSSCCASISADGRFVAFTSSATNLVPGGTHLPSQVFVRDLETGATELVSVASDGTPANGESSMPSLSAGGRVAAFVSRATNLTSSPTNGSQVFVHDRATGQTSMASLAVSGAPTAPIGPELGAPAISADGRFVAFASAADNLVPGDANPNGDLRVFRRDRFTNTTQRARIISGAPAKDDMGSSAPSLSSDGRFVVSRGGASEFGANQLLLWDAGADRAVVLSVAPDGSLGSFSTDQNSVPAMSADGQTATFSSASSTLALNDTNGFEDVFVVGNPVRSGSYLKSLVLDMTTVTGGAIVQGTLTLSGPAPAGGATVTLTSSGAEVQAPALVSVPAGSTTIVFTLPTLPVSSQRAVTIVASFGGGSPFSVLTLNPATPSRVVARAGDLQSVPISSPFQAVFQAEVLDAVDNPVRGVAVMFATPLAGPSGTFSNGMTSFVAATDANGLVTAPTFTANSIAGSYLVTASVAGVSNRGYFFLTNSATHSLAVASVNPSSGVGITVSPVDNGGLGNGTTQFSRIYNHNALVDLTAQATTGSNTFQKWQRDGVDFSTNTGIQVTVDAEHTLTAVYSAPAPTLTIGPATNIVASGTQAGPFAPSSYPYQLSTTTGSANFSISGVPSWLTASATSGAATTSAMTVTFTVNAMANSLTPGTYGPATITFTNTTNGQGNTSRTATLTVNPPPVLQVTPAANIATSGIQSGPFAPSAFAYQLSTTTGSANFSISGVPSWLTASATSGAATTSAMTVTFTVNAVANSLAPGTYGPATITFTNTTNGQDNTTRTATLTVVARTLGDFDGDGRKDLAVYRPTTGEWFIFGSITGFQTRLFGAPSASGLGDIPVPADYDGDGKTDMAIYRQATGEWFIFGTATGFQTRLFGAPAVSGLGDTPVPADFDGDGKADMAIYRKATGEWFIFGTATGFQTRLFGAPAVSGLGDTPVPADFDGDGKADMAIYRKATGEWFIFGTATGFRTILFGAPAASGLGDIPVPADFDGDLKTDVAIYRKATAEWFIFGSATGFRTTVFGAPAASGLGDTPVPGDFDGDGKADIAVRRNATAEWFVLQSSSGQVQTTTWGAPNDLPLPQPAQ